MLKPVLFFAICLYGLAAAHAQPVDTAVQHANTIRAGAIGYEDGYFGEGENRLHYVEAGKGPLVIFYHGFPSFWYSWFDQMEALKGRYRVVAVDGLGAGRSAKPENAEAYRVEKLAAQIDALARHLNGRKRFTLVGHDWGAALAFAYAQAYPKRLDAVVGMSAPPYNLFLDLVRTNKKQQARSTYMQLFRAVKLKDIRSRNMGEQIWKQSYDALIERGDLSKAEGELFRAALADPLAINGGMNWYRANMQPVEQIDDQSYWPSKNAKIMVPTLLIWGEADGTFVPDFIERMPGYAPKLKIVRLTGVNHWTSMERPDRANAALTDFLVRNVRR